MSRRQIKPTEAYGLLKTSLKYQTKEFFNNSTLHGVRYIAEEGRSFGEKFMWFCFVAIGAVAAFVIIGSLWEKFQTNPTITGLDTDFHNQQVLFPTVAVCPDNPYDLELVNQTAYRVLASYEENYEEYIPVLKALPKLSYETLKSTYDAFLNMSDELNIKNQNLRSLAFKVGIQCNDLFYEKCRYRDQEIECCLAFLPIFTEHGLCYAFNARYYGTENEEIKNDVVRDLFETDKKWSLVFVLNKPSKIFLHSLDEASGYDYRPQFSWELGFHVDLLITMKQTYTTDDARQLTIGQRKCIFPDETKLKYYKDDIYSFSACMKQCRMEKAQKFCQCIPPFYEPAVDNYRKCTFTDFSCLLKFRDNITDIKGCNQCELCCLNTVYDIEKFTKVMKTESEKREDFSINIEFLTWPIIRYKREVLFGWVDLLVSFGGIAGLFLGFSLLSGVEIIYYFTMRACCMMYKNREELYEIEEEKKKRPITQYDLSMKPKFKKLDRTKSLSMSSIKMVKPVISAGSIKAITVKAFDSPKVPIKNQNNVGPTVISKMVDTTGVYSRFQKSDNNKNIQRMKQIPRQNMFRKVTVAPYSSNIKPLDRKFKFRSHSEGPEPLFDGYLP